jgi:small conductance mechanosensitive channel
MFQEESVEIAPATAAETEVKPALADGFGDFVHRVSDGDLSTGTWVLLWESVGQPVVIALILIVAVLIGAGWLRRMTERALTRARVETTLTRFLSNLVRYFVLIAGGIAILGTLGVETTSFAAALAAAGFAIGMALSGTLSNVAAGIMLLFFRPFKAGDAVVVNGMTAKVYQINLFNTELDTFDNRRIIMPNSSVFNNTIENISYHKTRRVDVTVGTTYASDIDQARAVLTRTVKAVQGGLADPEPVVVLTEMGSSSINWAVRVWVKSEDFWDVRDRLTRDIKVALDQAKIGIPFPQMSVHLDGVLRRDE